MPEALLDPSSSDLGASCRVLGDILGLLGASWTILEVILGIRGPLGCGREDTTMTGSNGMMAGSEGESKEEEPTAAMSTIGVAHASLSEHFVLRAVGGKR